MLCHALVGGPRVGLVHRAQPELEEALVIGGQLYCYINHLQQAKSGIRPFLVRATFQKQISRNFITRHTNRYHHQCRCALSFLSRWFTSSPIWGPRTTCFPMISEWPGSDERLLIGKRLNRGRTIRNRKFYQSWGICPFIDLFIL